MTLLTAEQVAERLDITPRTVRNWCEGGALAAHKFAGVWAIDEAALETFKRPKMGRPTKETTMKKDEGLEKALESFISNGDEFHKAIESSIKAGWNGSGYSVELYSDGHYQVHRNARIGNKYVSPGVILGIPPLPSGVDVDNDDEDARMGALWFYADEAAGELRAELDDALEQMEARAELDDALEQMEAHAKD